MAGRIGDFCLASAVSALRLAGSLVNQARIPSTCGSCHARELEDLLHLTESLQEEATIRAGQPSN